jgi:hypothetical protein
VFSPILKHINQSNPNLSGCRELAGVVTLGPHWPAPAKRTIHRLRHSDREPLNAAPKATGPVCLHEEMEVIRLNAEL